MKRTLITGITGQDGSYLAELLLEKGYEVHGLVRRGSTFNTQRIEHLYSQYRKREKRLHLHYGDMADSSNLNRVLERTDRVEKEVDLCGVCVLWWWGSRAWGSR